MSLDSKVMYFAHCYNNYEETLDNRHHIKNNCDWLYGKEYRCGDVEDQKLFKINGLAPCPFYLKGNCDTSRPVPKEDK